MLLIDLLHSRVGLHNRELEGWFIRSLCNWFGVASTLQAVITALQRLSAEFMNPTLYADHMHVLFVAVMCQVQIAIYTSHTLLLALDALALRTTCFIREGNQDSTASLALLPLVCNAHHVDVHTGGMALPLVVVELHNQHYNAIVYKCHCGTHPAPTDTAYHHTLITTLLHTLFGYTAHCGTLPTHGRKANGAKRNFGGWPCQIAPQSKPH